ETNYIGVQTEDVSNGRNPGASRIPDTVESRRSSVGVLDTLRNKLSVLGDVHLVRVNRDLVRTLGEYELHHQEASSLLVCAVLRHIVELQEEAAMRRCSTRLEPDSAIDIPRFPVSPRERNHVVWHCGIRN